MLIDERFQAAVAWIKSAPPSKASTNEVKLQLYSLFKQAKSGDCASSRPGMFDPVGRAKWDAWDGLKGLANDEAKQRYIDLLRKLTCWRKAQDTDRPTFCGLHLSQFIQQRQNKCGGLTATSLR